MYCREQKERERLQKLEQERERKQKEEEERRKKEEMKRKKVEQERIEKEKAEKAAKIKVNTPIIFLFFTPDFLKSLPQDVVAKIVRGSGSCIKYATICVIYVDFREGEKPSEHRRVHLLSLLLTCSATHQTHHCSFFSVDSATTRQPLALPVLATICSLGRFCLLCQIFLIMFVFFYIGCPASSERLVNC